MQPIQESPNWPPAETASTLRESFYRPTLATHYESARDGALALAPEPPSRGAAPSEQRQAEPSPCAALVRFSANPGPGRLDGTVPCDGDGGALTAALMRQSVTQATLAALAIPLARSPGETVQAAVQRMQSFVDRACETTSTGGGDVAQILAALPMARSLDDQAPINSAGVYALTSFFPIIGPLCSAYYGARGVRLLLDSSEDLGALRGLRQHIKAREARVTALLESAGPVGEHVLANLQVQQRALRNFETGVRVAQRGEVENIAMPGLVGTSASAALLLLAINRMPTLGHETQLLPLAVGSALGAVGGALLTVFGLAMLAKSARGAHRAWTTPKAQQATLQGSEPKTRMYLQACNQALSQRRAYHTLGCVSAATCTAASIGVMVTSLGVSAAPSIVWMVLASACGAPVVWELMWGRQMGPHNANTPHLDRDALQAMEPRRDTWHLLRAENVERRQAVRTITDSLHRTRRYHVLRWLPHGEKRLGHWCVKDLAAADAPLHAFMLRYTSLEMDALRTRLSTTQTRLEACYAEVQRADVAALRERIASEVQAHATQVSRLTAMQGLHDALRALDTQGLRGIDAQAWKALRLSFLVIHNLVDRFFNKQQVKAHPQWFQLEKRRTRLTGREVITRARITSRGLQQAAAGFDKALERRFINLLLTSGLNTYESDAVLAMELEAWRAEAKAPTELGTSLPQTLQPRPPLGSGAHAVAP